MKPFTLKKRKKREVWLVATMNDDFTILDANTEECLVFERFATRAAAEAYAKSKKWRVV